MLNLTLKERLLVSSIGYQQPPRPYRPGAKSHPLLPLLVLFALTLMGGALYSFASAEAPTAPSVQR